MSLGKRLFIGGAAAECFTDTVDIFDDSSGVALYSLDYDASDASGNYDGTPSSGVTFGELGNINYSGSFDGTSTAKITIPDANVFSPASNDVSVSLWFKTNDSTSAQYLISKAAAGLNYEWGLLVSDTDKLVGICWQSSGANHLTAIKGGDNLVNNQWYHVVMTMDAGSKLEVFLDKVSVAEDTTPTGSMINGTGPVMIGGRSDLTTLTMNGNIDQVRIFNKILSQEEIDTLYDEERCVYTSTTNNNALGGTNLAYYKLDGDATDEKGSYDGTESNITYAFGRYGAAASFNGSSSYIDTNFQMPSTTEFSFSCWFNKDNSSANYHLIGDFNSSATLSSGRFRVQLNNADAISVGVGNGTSMDFSVFTPSVSLNNIWRHIVVTVNGTSVKAYIDGSQVGTTDTSLYSLASGVNNFAIGAYHTASVKQNFDGLIDQVRFFSSALDQDDIDALYAERQEQITLNSTDPYGDGDLVAYYKLDNNADDALDTYDGTAYNVTFSTDRLFGTHSASFNGSSSYIDLGNIIDFGSSNYTVSFFFNASVVGGARAFFATYNGSGLLINIESNNKLRFYHSGGTAINIQTLSTLSNNTWYHVACVMNHNSIAELYLNGVSQGTATGSNLGNASGGNAFLGNYPSGSYYFEGKIDQVRVFDRALEGDEVFQLYSEGVLDE